MKKLIYVLVVLVFFLLGLGFHLNNQQSIMIKYYMGLQTELPLSALLLIVLAIGIFIGYFASLIKSLKLRRRLSVANKAVENLESEQALG